VAALNLRQVTPRNAPTVVNSVFTVRKFRDGRASDIFAGRTPFGDSDARLNAVAVFEGRLSPERVRIANSSLASQAVGPPLNTTEMSYEELVEHGLRSIDVMLDPQAGIHDHLPLVIDLSFRPPQ